MKNIQYGAGLCGPIEWENFDSSPMLLLQRAPILRLLPLAKKGAKYPPTVRFGDVLKGLPVPTASADRVYCSHVLEHFTLSDCRKVLRETRRMLAPGGVFRGVMPDLRALCRDYLLKPPSDPVAAHEFMSDSGLGVKETPAGLEWVRQTFFSRSKHFWLWDYSAIEREILAAGFTAVRSAEFNDSKFPEFLSVEDAGRWHKALGFEASWK